MESRVQELWQSYYAGALAGPRGLPSGTFVWELLKKSFIKDIEKRLSIPKSVASNLVKRRRKRFVELRHRQGQRYKYVHLTDLGKKKAQDVDISERLSMNSY